MLQYVVFEVDNLFEGQILSGKVHNIFVQNLQMPKSNVFLGLKIRVWSAKSCLLENPKSASDLWSRGPISGCCGAVCFNKNRRPNGGTRGPISRDSFFRKHIFGPDLLQFYEGYFYYKYWLCIRANFEIEGVKQVFRKTTIKLWFA